jgi:hypothetical protein
MSLAPSAALAVQSMASVALYPPPAGGAPGAVMEGTPAEGGEAEGEGDDKTYCFCDGISYGEMIACDDANCEREWVLSFLIFVALVLIRDLLLWLVPFGVYRVDCFS